MEGPPRKYYRLTALGYDYKENLEREWLAFQNAVNNIIMGGYKCE
ncbi:DNA-binding PadR family transcriptional regulator [Clostridium sardiniense]|nr:DNA-binding PadR family transcriptional regulator [Clostridium sardiniense]